jgi:uncharacterized protein YkwD
MPAMRALCIAFMLLMCAACADVPAPAPAPPPPDPKTQMQGLESRIYELIQDERHKIDPTAKPLALDSELVGVARQRAADMATKNYFAHAGPDGATSATLIMDQDAKFQGLLGENIAAQYYGKQTGVDVEVFAHRFVDSWLGSPAHKENLAYPAYDRTGVGAAVNDNMVYVTQLFATDLGLPPPPDDPPPEAKRQITQFSNAADAAKPNSTPLPKDIPIPAPKPRPDP